jgi:hypothetical protein
MTLERYSRPNNDTGYGFHYYPDTEHYSPVDIKRWVPELKNMGASWLVMLSKLEVPIPEFFLNRLVGSEIEPIVSVMTPLIRPVDVSCLTQLLGTYAASGVHYVEVFSEPNRASRWPVEDWCCQSLVERFVDLLLPCLEEMQAVGLHPVFPSLNPGGDYWDLAFLESSLGLLVSRAGERIFQNMAIGVHDDVFDRPLSWGDGGHRRWPMAGPYFTPGDSEDHIGHNIFKWYDEIIQSTLGRSLGLLSLGSMPNGDSDRLSTSAWTDQQAHADRAVAIGRRVMDGEIPSYVINHAYWLLATSEADPNAVHAWYGAQGESCQAVSAMKGLLKHSRKDQQRLSESTALAPKSVAAVEFVGLSTEMIDRLQIEGPSRSDLPYWKVIRVEVRPDTENMSAYAMADAEAVRFSWPDGQYTVSPKDDPYAPMGARQRAASMPMFAVWSSYAVEVLGNSQVLRGFGLYGDNLELTQGRNHPVLVTFALTDPSGEDAAPTEPVPPEPPAPEPGPVPPGPGGPAGAEFVGLSEAMIDRLQIEGASRSDLPYWKVIRVEVSPGTENMSAYAIADAQAIRFSWPDGEYIASPRDDPYAPAGARQRAASMPMFAVWGSYAVEILGNSQVLRGFGLYGDNLELTQRRNHPVLVTFVLTDPPGEDPAPAEPVPPEPPAPEPEPVSPEPVDPPAPTPGWQGRYARFARPPKDNGMGIHFGLNTTTEAIAQDIARAKEMRLTWGTLCYQGEEQLLRCAKMMWDAGIMPVCRQVLSIDRRHPFGRDAKTLIEHGIPAYIQIFNEPSDPREWEEDRPRDYKKKWAELWAEKAEDVYNSGGYAGLQCLSLEELEAAIDALGVGSPVWQRVWFCCHNYALNHPPDWKGDVWSVQGFLFFADVFRRRLGFVPPIICGEGGWLYGASDDPRFARVVGEIHAKYTRHVYKWFRRSKLTGGAPLPAYLFAVCPWILSGPTNEAWYGYTTKELTIQAVKSIPEFERIRAASTECGEEG